MEENVLRYALILKKVIKSSNIVHSMLSLIYSINLIDNLTYIKFNAKTVSIIINVSEYNYIDDYIFFQYYTGLLILMFLKIT